MIKRTDARIREIAQIGIITLLCAATMAFGNASGNASGNVDFDEYKEKFLLETGYDFHEVYLYYAQRYKEKFDQDNTPKSIEAPTGLSNSPEYFVPSSRALPKPEPDIITPSYNDDDVIFD